MQFVNVGQSNSVKIHSTFLHVSRHVICSVPLGSDSAQFHHYKPKKAAKAAYASVYSHKVVVRQLQKSLLYSSNK